MNNNMYRLYRRNIIMDVLEFILQYQIFGTFTGSWKSSQYRHFLQFFLQHWIHIPTSLRDCNHNNFSSLSHVSLHGDNTIGRLSKSKEKENRFFAHLQVLLLVCSFFDYL